MEVKKMSKNEIILKPTYWASVSGALYETAPTTTGKARSFNVHIIIVREVQPMANTFYSAQTVLRNFVADNDYTITQQSMNFSGARYSKVWVEEKDGVTSLLCCQRTRTMFEIFGYNSDYSENFRTSFDYADVNTPPLAVESPAE